MTCVIALKSGDAVYMGADSAGVAGLALQRRSDRKIYRVGAMLIGFTTSFRMGQLLGYSLVLPEHHEDVTVERYLATVFVDATRTCLKAGGFAGSKDGVEQGGDFLVAYRGRIFTVHGDYQVAETVEDYAAVGCGLELALGSLHTTEKFGTLSGEERVRCALEAAARFSAGVCDPFHIEALNA